MAPMAIRTSVADLASTMVQTDVTVLRRSPRTRTPKTWRSTMVQTDVTVLRLSDAQTVTLHRACAERCLRTRISRKPVPQGDEGLGSAVLMGRVRDASMLPIRTFGCIKPRPPRMRMLAV